MKQFTGRRLKDEEQDWKSGRGKRGNHGGRSGLERKRDETKKRLE